MTGSENRRLRRRLCRPRHRSLLRRARPRRRAAGRRAREDRGAARRRDPDPRAGSRRARRAQPRAAEFTTDVAEAIDGAEFLFVASARRRRTPGDADLSRGLDRDRRAAAARRPHRARDEVDVPVGTGDQGPRGARCARPRATSATSSNPEFLAEGTARRDFMHPDRIVDRRLRRATDGDAVADLHAALDAPIVRTDVNSAEMIKMASNAFLSTRISFINEIANVCELDRRGRHGGRQGHGARPPSRQALPARRDRLRRLVLPEGRLGAEAARRATPATTSSCCRR